MVNVIFLDIDGVLNHSHFGKDTQDRYEFANDCIANLKKILLSVADCKIVVSSNWRRFKTNAEMFNGRPWRNVLEEKLGIEGVIIDDVPTLASNSRADEIEAWMNANKEKLGVGTYVIFDDECSTLRKKFPNNVVDCSIATGEGLSERKANDAIWILSDYGKNIKKNEKIWFTADSHFCHENIIKYCNRPYANAYLMNEDLIKRWNAVVKPNDIVWHLGDFCFGKKENVQSIFPRLNGKIRIVLGNHDHHKMKFYYDVGFQKVYDRPILFNNFFILSHAPLQWISNNLPFANIFGHVHDSDVYKTFTARSACVCVERWNYAPIDWETIVDGMKTEEEKA